MILCFPFLNILHVPTRQLSLTKCTEFDCDIFRIQFDPYLFLKMKDKGERILSTRRLF